MTEAIKNNNHNKAFLEMLGVSYGETYISFNERKFAVRHVSMKTHLEAVHLALQLTLPEHKVTVQSEDKVHRVFVNDTLVMTYKPHWLTGEMQYNRKHDLRLRINTVDHGNFVGGLVEIFFNGIFGAPAKTTAEQSARVVH